MLIVGLDLTDPYARAPRPVDVAAVDPATRRIHFPPPLAWAPTGAREMAHAVTEQFPPASHCLVLDAPQALASPGRPVRACETACGAPGRTPDRLPEPGSRPFAGFIRGSVELWSALLELGGWRVGSIARDEGSHRGNLFEAYPGDIWTRLAGRGALASKATALGRQQRTDLLERHGFRLPHHRLSHDQLDAAICAVVGCWGLHAVQRREPAVDLLGCPAWVCAEGRLREGQMLRPASALRSTPLDRTAMASTPSPTRAKARGRALMCGESWIYRASPAGIRREGTYELASEEQVIWRPAWNVNGQPIANVRWLRPGDPIVLNYSGSAGLLLAVLGDVGSAGGDLSPLDDFAACVAAVTSGSRLERRLESAGYRRPNHQEQHTVLVLREVIAAAHDILAAPLRGRNAITRTKIPLSLAQKP